MKVPFLCIPATLVAATLAGVWASGLFSIPSLTVDFPPAPLEHAGSPLETVHLLVDGVRCVDTAEGAASTLADLPGIRRFVAYASRARLEITFDPRKATPLAIVEALEGPVLQEATGEYRFGVYRVVEIDGAGVPRQTGSHQTR